MEKEQQKTPPTLKELLGHANKPGEIEVGIINETEKWIHRRALDYLMVGFVTDADQVESQKEQRYENYIDTISTDLTRYYDDVYKWNVEHLQNALPATWQTEYDYQKHQEVRRIDLPSVDVCLASIVDLGQYRETPPTREDIKYAAAEGLEIYYDEALEKSCRLMSNQLNDIAAELPTAPHEPLDGVATYDELLAEQKAINSRLNAAEQLYLQHHPIDTADNLAPLRPLPHPEAAPVTGPTYVVRQMGKVGTTLVRTDK